MMRPDRSRQLADVCQPVLAITGDADRVVALVARRRFIDLLPHAEWSAVADAGHVPDTEQAAVVPDDVHAWLVRYRLTTRRQDATDV